MPSEQEIQEAKEKIQKKRAEFDAVQQSNINDYPLPDNWTGLGDKDLEIANIRLLSEILIVLRQLLETKS